jgi:hypothetical protein
MTMNMFDPFDYNKRVKLGWVDKINCGISGPEYELLNGITP